MNHAECLEHYAEIQRTLKEILAKGRAELAETITAREAV